MDDDRIEKILLIYVKAADVCHRWYDTEFCFLIFRVCARILIIVNSADASANTANISRRNENIRRLLVFRGHLTRWNDETLVAIYGCRAKGVNLVADGHSSRRSITYLGDSWWRNKCWPMIRRWTSFAARVYPCCKMARVIFHKLVPINVSVW